MCLSLSSPLHDIQPGFPIGHPAPFCYVAKIMEIKENYNKIMRLPIHRCSLVLIPVINGVYFYHVYRYIRNSDLVLTDEIKLEIEEDGEI